MNKKCKVCGEVLPLTKFKENKTMRSYYNSCKVCFDKEAAERYQRKKKERDKMNATFGFFLFSEKWFKNILSENYTIFCYLYYYSGVLDFYVRGNHNDTY